VGDNQDQTILQAFLNVLEFWDDWYPNSHQAFEWPRVQTLHFDGSFWPHSASFNKRATAVIIDSATTPEYRGTKCGFVP